MKYLLVIPWLIFLGAAMFDRDVDSLGEACVVWVVASALMDVFILAGWAVYLLLTEVIHL